MRIKPGVAKHRRLRRILKAVKGYRGARHRRIKLAKEAIIRAGAKSYYHKNPLEPHGQKTLYKRRNDREYTQASCKSVQPTQPYRTSLCMFDTPCYGHSRSGKC